MQMLLEAGIPNSQIEISPTCTYSNPHLYYSARLTQGKTGRFGAGIMLKALKCRQDSCLAYLKYTENPALKCLLRDFGVGF